MKIKRAQKPLPAAFQLKVLQHFCRTNFAESRQGGIIWEGWIRPHIACEEYLVRVEYKTGQDPDVFVLKPELRPREEGGKIPHMFSQRRLCLFRSRNRHWDSSKSFSRNIIPWISLWLYYYEIWKGTGQWLGGGEHVSNVDVARMQRRRETRKNRLKIGGN